MTPTKSSKSAPVVSAHVNRKARHDYEVLAEYEAGIELLGYEVKSIRDGLCNLRGSHVSIRGHSAYILNMHVSPYRSMGNKLGVNPKRERKLLLHARDLIILDGKTRERGITLIPMEVYWRGNLIKIRVALVRGRKLHDKRRMLKERDMERDIRVRMRGGEE